MEQIVALAKQLAEAVKAHPRYQAFRQAQQKLESSPESKQLLEQLAEQSKRIRELEAALKPVEPQDKRRLIEIQERVMADPTIRALFQAEADYAEIMVQINNCMRDILGE